jgi:hypothetical protein
MAVGRRTAGRKNRGGDRGSVLVEFALAAPLVLTVLLGAIDMGRLMRISEVTADVGRTAAAAGARGFEAPQAVEVARSAKAALKLDEIGITFVTLVGREDVHEPTPWVVSRVSGSNLPGFASRFGAPGEPARLQAAAPLQPGMRLTAVEVAIPFEPLFPLGAAVYPRVVYAVTYF